MEPKDKRRRWLRGGFFVRRECWCLTGRSRLFLGVLVVVAIVLGHWAVHPFLAVTSPVRGELLIVEGWVPNDTLEQAASEFTLGQYERVLVVRAIYDTADPYTSGRYKGDYVAELLVKAGVPKDRVDSLFFSVVRTDRTYESALRVKQWLETNAVPSFTVKSMDVATSGPHARRSRLLYRKVFGSQLDVGVIALEGITYDPARWWRYSEGVKEVTGELVAYIYARVFFRGDGGTVGRFDGATVGRLAAAKRAARRRVGRS